MSHKSTISNEVETVGDFRLVGLIGQGGMGQVWEAEQISLGRRHVAVKFVRPERVTPHQLELFEREARAGGRLHHPGIVTVHGHGASDGLAWIAIGSVALRENMPLVGMAAALMFVGFAFKISAAPFQVWAPDVYQGAPAPVAAFMSAGPKAAAFAIFVRVYMTAFEPIAPRWEPVLWICALLTMIVGNFAALRQNMPMDIRSRWPGKGHTAEALADAARVQAIWREHIARFGGPYLFGDPFTIADAMFAPVTTRFVTYGVDVDDVARGYIATIAAVPGMVAWCEAAKTEPWTIDYDAKK